MDVGARDDSAGTQRRALQWQRAQQAGLRALASGKLGPHYGLVEGDPLLGALAAQAEAIGLDRFRHQLTYAAERPSLVGVARLSLPLLVVSGEHDALCPPALGAEAAALSTAGRHTVLPGAGHLFPMQQAEATRGCVRHAIGLAAGH